MTTRRKHYDVAVIGLGTMGSFAAAELARRGFSVAGFDQFTPPHARGSHTGGTRIYRVAYAEGAGYVPLALRAGELWERFDKPLLHRTGVLYMGRPDEALIQEVAQSASAHRLQVESLSPAEVKRRHPAFEIPEDYTALFDTQAGWLDVDASIAASLAHAQAAGVECFFGTPVQAWNATASEVRVHAEKETVTAASLIITAGAWAGRLLHDLRLPLAVKRKVFAWFDPLTPELFAPDRTPVFAFTDGWSYGFPSLGGLGVKMALHAGGSYLADADVPVAPPGPEDLDPIAAVAAKFMPRLAGPYSEARSRIRHSATCLYTMTPDENFIVDHHPEFKNVVFAVGFSGHGFKFAPVIAVALADLVQEGKTSLPVSFLSLDRLSSFQRS
jgi:monomeric sarcosine oxidase